MKTCSKCKKSKPLFLFSVGSSKLDGLHSYCKECDREYRAEHKETLAVQNKVGQMRRNYNLTPTQYQELIANGCEVCRSMDNLHIDHDHRCCPGQKTCGRCIRGVLCSNHNRAIGFTHDNIDELLAMATYLMQFENVLSQNFSALSQVLM